MADLMDIMEKPAVIQATIETARCAGETGFAAYNCRDGGVFVDRKRIGSDDVPEGSALAVDFMFGGHENSGIGDAPSQHEMDAADMVSDDATPILAAGRRMMLRHKGNYAEIVAFRRNQPCPWHQSMISVARIEANNMMSRLGLPGFTGTSYRRMRSRMDGSGAQAASDALKATGVYEAGAIRVMYDEDPAQREAFIRHVAGDGDIARDFILRTLKEIESGECRSTCAPRGNYSMRASDGSVIARASMYKGDLPTLYSWRRQS